MISKRTGFYFLGLLFSMLVVWALLAILYYYSIGYLEARLIPELIHNAGIGDATLRVRNVGLTGCELADVRLGDAPGPGLTIDSVRVDYGLIGLFKGRVDRITVSGVSIDVACHGDTLRVGGLDGWGSAGREPSGESASPPPVSVGRIDVRHSVVTCRWQEAEYRFPFELTIVPDGSMRGFARFLFEVFPRGQRVRITGTQLAPGHMARIAITGDAIDIQRFADIWGHVPGLGVTGRAQFDAQAQLSLQPFKLTSLSVAARLHGAAVEYSGMMFQNHRSSGTGEVPMGFSLQTDDFESWDLHLFSFLCRTPVGETQAAGAGSLTVSDTDIRFSGHVRTGVVLPHPPRAGWPPQSPPVVSLPALRWEVSGRRETGGDWQAQAEGRAEAGTGDVLEILRFQGGRIQSGVPEILLSAQGRGPTFSAAYTLDVPTVRIDSDAGRVTVPAVTVRGDVESAPGSEHPDRLSFSVRARDIRGASAQANARIPTVDISGHVTRKPGGNVTLGGRLDVSKASLVIPSQSLTVNGVAARLPFEWPPPADPPMGKLTVGAMQWRHLALGRVDADVRQKGRGVAGSGTYSSRLLPGLGMVFHGHVGEVAGDWIGRVQVELPTYRTSAEIDLGRFIPAAAGVHFNGALTLAADLGISGAGPNGSLGLDLRDARVRLDEPALILDGISADLSFPDVTVLRSAPGQSLRVARVSYGDIAATDFSVGYQIEPPGVLFVEHSRFNWCRGQVSTQAFRVTPDVADYRLTLYCDRLNLAQVLEQFGAANASGDGAVNGRIPVQFTQGRLTFQDGFLYSTPGAGGSIRVADTGVLTAGLPPGSPQFVQMDIAREALKDFDYVWVKMNLETDDRDLLMSLQFDGKPAVPLPFVYQRDIGQFARVAADAQGSVFQGIRLDVNFRLPLDDILKYKDVLKLIE